jgi:hypothetical protein
MGVSVHIRSYRKEDIDYIIDRHRELYEVEYGFTLTETKENSTWTDDIIKEERWDLSL